MFILVIETNYFLTVSIGIWVLSINIICNSKSISWNVFNISNIQLINLIAPLLQDVVKINHFILSRLRMCKLFTELWYLLCISTQSKIVYLLILFFNFLQIILNFHKLFLMLNLDLLLLFFVILLLSLNHRINLSQLIMNFFILLFHVLRLVFNLNNSICHLFLKKI